MIVGLFVLHMSVISHALPKYQILVGFVFFTLLVFALLLRIWGEKYFDEIKKETFKSVGNIFICVLLGTGFIYVNENIKGLNLKLIQDSN